MIIYIIPKTAPRNIKIKLLKYSLRKYSIHDWWSLMVEVLKLKRHSPPIGWYLRTLNLSRELIKDSKFIVSNQNLLDILQKEYKNVTYFNWK